jgi:D-alanyl-D-alanine carboxypeptidase (penicillin-binding protein 5/6)
VSRRTAGAAVAGAVCAAVLAGLPGGAAARAPDAPSPPPIAASAYALYAPATGQMLAGSAADQERPIASTTKLMTAAIVLEHVHDLNTVFTYPDYHQAADDSQIGLRPGDRMTVRDLLIAMLLPSADDAAEDLADNVGHGSVTRFVGWMNAQARALHLTHTHYSTPIGLDTPGNYSSASDLVRLAAYDLSHFPVFARVVNMPTAQLSTGPVREVSNLNGLVADYPWVTGVKTGHTDGAGYVLVASGRRDGMSLISAVLGTDSETARDTDALALLDYGYRDFRTWTPIHAQQALAHLTVKDRPGLRVPVRAARSFTRVLARSSHVHLRVRVPHQLSGPLPSGAIVGSAAVLEGHRTLAHVPVVLERRLPAVSRLTLLARVITRPWVLALLAAATATLLAAGLMVAGRRGPRGPGPRDSRRSGRSRRPGRTGDSGSDWGRA